MKDEIRTLRGFLTGTEREEEPYFAYSATLRISGDIPDLKAISTELGLVPTHTHKKGEKRAPRSAPYRQDMWSYSPELKESEPLYKHIEAL